MKTSEVRTWFEQLPHLSQGQAERVRRELGETPPAPETVQWLEQLYHPRCPRSDGEGCYRWGATVSLPRLWWDVHRDFGYTLGPPAPEVAVADLLRGVEERPDRARQRCAL